MWLCACMLGIPLVLRVHKRPSSCAQCVSSRCVFNLSGACKSPAWARNRKSDVALRVHRISQCSRFSDLIELFESVEQPVDEFSLNLRRKSLRKVVHRTRELWRCAFKGSVEALWWSSGWPTTMSTTTDERIQGVIVVYILVIERTFVFSISLCRFATLMLRENARRVSRSILHGTPTSSMSSHQSLRNFGGRLILVSTRNRVMP